MSLNKQVVLIKVEELWDQIKKAVLLKANDLLDSGALDLEQYSDEDYLLPKLLLCAAAQEIEDAYHPLTPDQRRQLHKLRCF